MHNDLIYALRADDESGAPVPLVATAQTLYGNAAANAVRAAFQARSVLE